MAAIIDTSVWIDIFRRKTPRHVRELARSVFDRKDAMLCKPVKLELLRGVSERHYPAVAAYLTTVPMLATPITLWSDALVLARKCYAQGHPVSSMDTLIAAVCLFYEAELVTFDADFLYLSAVSPLKLQLRPRAD